MRGRQITFKTVSSGDRYKTLNPADGPASASPNRRSATQRVRISRRAAFGSDSAIAWTQAATRSSVAIIFPTSSDKRLAVAMSGHLVRGTR